MMGKRHIACGLGLTSAFFASVVTIDGARHDHGVLGEGVRVVHDALVPAWATSVTHAPFFVIAAACALVLGSVWPDCDTSSSMVGRFVPTFRMRHRGWTHTDWALIILAGLCVFDPTHLGWWFFAGYFTHLILDELSAAGRVHFYPLTDHKVISRDGHEIVVKRRWHGLYTTGSHSSSERAVVMTVLVLSVAVIAVCAAMSMR